MTLSELINQLNQIVADNPKAGNLPVHETYYVSRGDYNAGYEAYYEVRKVLVGEAEGIRETAKRTLPAGNETSRFT